MVGGSCRLSCPHNKVYARDRHDRYFNLSQENTTKRFHCNLLFTGSCSTEHSPET